MHTQALVLSQKERGVKDQETHIQISELFWFSLHDFACFSLQEKLLIQSRGNESVMAARALEVILAYSPVQ